MGFNDILIGLDQVITPHSVGKHIYFLIVLIMT
jgi:hypothetical protein